MKCLMIVTALFFSACSAPNVPGDQQSLLNTLESFSNQYRQANRDENMLVADDLAGRQKTYIASLDKQSFSRWLAEVDGIGSAGNDATAAFRIADHIIIRNSVILKRDTRIFTDIRNLKKGDIVYLSGVFAGFETSFTESGRMSEPELAAQFQKVETK